MKTIEIDGIKYQLTPIEENKPETLYDIIDEWWNCYSNNSSVFDLIAQIEQWIPEKIKYKAMGSGIQEWIDGYNAYHEELLKKLK